MKNIHQPDVEKFTTTNEISRKEMLTNMGVLAGASLLNPIDVFSGTKTKPEPQPNNNMFSLKGKTAIVTGAARGIGRAIAIALASAGADIMGIDIAAAASPEVIYASATKQELDETGRLVKALKQKFIPVVADTRDIDAIRVAVNQAIKEFGKVDILVADAGIQVYSPIAEMSNGNGKM
jgi:hypothetical protein